jgi:hypothetical protein
MSENTTVIHHTQTLPNGDEVAQTTLTSAEDQREKTILAKPYVIPVLFLPGIMGTNLRSKGSKKKAWRPPNSDASGAMDLIGQLFSYAFKSTEKRAEELTTPAVEIDPRGPIDTGDSGLPENVLVARGWGSVMRSCYHPFLGQLQHELNQLSIFDFKECKAKLQGWAAQHGADAPSDWGANSSGATPLSETEILHAANYQFDVWAGGYNWLQSNRDSGAAIKDYIENVILPYYNEGKKVTVKDTPDGQGNAACSIQRKKPTRPRAEGVIVVTHSMGGMVSRALTEIHQCDKVLGVSHGVQPATGAPATYKRMRSGFEGAEQLFLGRNAADVVAILSQAPGGLELLPTADYNDGKPWLKVRDKNGQEILALPKTGNPYDEIYTSPAWYGMVPDANLALMNPGLGIGATTNNGTAQESAPRDKLNEVVGRIQEFHESIQRKYKTPTYAHCGAQGKRNSTQQAGGLLGTGLLASKHLFSWGEIAWEGDGAAALDAAKIVIQEDDGNGELTTNSGIKLAISKPDCPGDGTVPIYSGEAPNKAGIAMSFSHGHGNPGKCNTRFGYDHQGSYSDDRALFASLFAIIKIAQQARWHQK